MTELAHGIWAGATATIAYCGHRVAITWLNQREQMRIRAEFRDERDGGVQAKHEALESEFKKLATEMRTLAANLRSR